MDDSDNETEAPMDQNDSPTDPLPPPVFDYDEEMDFDEPPQFTSTSTPRANRNDQQPSTSGTQRSQMSIRTSSSSSSYHRDLQKSTPIQINILVPRFPNFNGRTCHFISSLKAVLFCWKEKNENIPKPNAGQDLFTRLLCEIFWNHADSNESVNVEPIWDSFIATYMKQDLQNHHNHPAIHSHPKQR